MGSAPDVFVYLAHKSEDLTGNVSYVANGVRALTGWQAFRGYNWMTDVRAVNSAQNFRGMVVSARWATTYQVIARPAANVFGTVATVASLAANAIDMAPQFEAVWRSGERPEIKSLRTLSLAGTVAQKTLAAIVTGGVHLIYRPLILGCSAAAKAGGGGGFSNAASLCSETVKNADALVQTSSAYITDPINQQRWVQSYVSVFIN